MIYFAKFLKKGIFGILFFLLLFSFVTTPTQVYAQGTTAPSNSPSASPTPGASPTTQNDEDVACAIEKIGWLLCPIMEGMAKISDKTFDTLANNFLRTDPQLISDKSGTKTAWEVARNLANIMFIIAFVIIILSQVTGQGISNYGIKRMLPRLIIAAIAVNVSYYICQLAVDVTNILGYEIQNALQGIADGIGPSVFGQVSDYSTAAVGNDSTRHGVGILEAIMGAALGATAVVWLIVGPGIAVVTVVLITVLTILVILLLRKAIIVLLIVVSPIAFVLYLLPNTEKLFSRWMKMFTQLLMVFPVVGLLFGAGQLASTIILVSSTNGQPPTAAAANCDPDTQPTNQSSDPSTRTGYAGSCDGYISIQGSRSPGNTKQLQGVSWTAGLVAMGVAVAPLMAVYAVLKGALSAAGAIGGMVQSMGQRGKGMGSKVAGTLDDRRKKRLETSALGNTTFGKGINVATLGSARRRAKRKAIDTSQDRELHMAQLDYTSKQAMESKGFQRQLAGGSMLIPGSANADAMGRAEANAINQQRELLAKEIAAEHTTVDAMSIVDKDATGAVINPEKGGDAGREAQRLINGGNFDSPRLAALLEQLGKTNQQAFMQLASQVGSRGVSTAASRSAADVMSNMGYYGGGDVASMRNGTMAPTNPADLTLTLEETARKNVEGGGLSPADLAKMSNDGLKTLDVVIASTPAARTNVSSAFGRMTNDQRNALSEEKMRRLSGF